MRRSSAFVFAAFGLLCANMVMPRAPSIDGVWAADLTMRNLVAGTLTVDGRSNDWVSTVAGYAVTATHDDSTIQFALPGDAGAFRGRLASQGTKIDGQWIQPPAPLWSIRYATPVHLQQVSPRVWRGTIVPLPERVSFYISVRSSPDGARSATILNPEFNLFRRRTYDVQVSDSVVTLVNHSRAGDRFHAVYSASRDQLFAPLIDGQPPIVLSRRSETEAIGFAALPRGLPRSAATPLPASDGWQTSSLASVGIDPRPIEALVDSIAHADPANNPVAIHSLLIARHGKLVFEQYFYGFDATRPHDMRSASKTFAPLLAGIARDLGAPIRPDLRVYDVLNDHRAVTTADPRRAAIRLSSLMTMTSGLACDDNDDRSPGNEDVMQSQAGQPDWYRYTLDLPMVNDPNTNRAIYCSAGMNLVGDVVATTVHRPLPEFFEQYVARPLQFGEYHMNLMPTGAAYMAGGLYLLPRDEMKLGQLYLDGGRWNGKRVVSADWVKQSVTTHAAFSPQTDYDAPHEYGFGWHINYVPVGNRKRRMFSAGGNGGQLVLVVPDLDLVVGINGGAYGEFPEWYRWGLLLVPQYILPAVSSAAPSGR
jgi:CubicO group peptidase (beta-lactamase class C family)